MFRSRKLNGRRVAASVIYADDLCSDAKPVDGGLHIAKKGKRVSCFVIKGDYHRDIRFWGFHQKNMSGREYSREDDSNLYAHFRQ
jgi:hypothetical protein